MGEKTNQNKKKIDLAPGLSSKIDLAPALWFMDLAPTLWFQCAKRKIYLLA